MSHLTGQNNSFQMFTYSFSKSRARMGRERVGTAIEYHFNRLEMTTIPVLAGTCWEFLKDSSLCSKYKPKQIGF